MRRTPLILSSDAKLEEALDRIPSLDLELLRKLQHTNEEEKTLLEDEINHLESSRTEKISEIPYSTFSPNEEVEWFFTSNMLKPSINQKTGVNYSEITKEISKKKQFLNLLKETFWLVHYIQIHPSKLNLISSLRKKVTKSYSKILPIIQKFDKPTSETVLLQLQFLIGYLSHSTHFKKFRDIREKFNTRFILDCYHIIIFELTGLLVSDFFIHKNIEIFFGDRLFFYKEESALKLTNIDPNSGSVFLDSYGKFKKNYEELKVINNEDSENKSRIFDLYKELSRKFSYIEKMNTKKSGLMANLLQSEYKKRLEDLAKMDKFERAVLKFRIEEFDKKLKNNNFKQEIKESEYEEKEFNRRTEIYLTHKKPKIHKKFKFDCTQISPPLRDLIGNSSKMPVKKKQIHLSNVQLPDFSAKDLAHLYNKNTQSSLKMTKRNKTADKLSLFFGKKLQDHANLVKVNPGASKLMDTPGIKQSIKRKFMTFYQMSDVKKKINFYFKLKKNIK